MNYIASFYFAPTLIIQPIAYRISRQRDRALAQGQNPSVATAIAVSKLLAVAAVVMAIYLLALHLIGAAFPFLSIPIEVLGVISYFWAYRQVSALQREGFIPNNADWALKINALCCVSFLPSNQRLSFMSQAQQIMTPTMIDDERSYILSALSSVAPSERASLINQTATFINRIHARAPEGVNDNQRMHLFTTLAEMTQEGRQSYFQRRRAALVRAFGDELLDNRQGA